MKNITPQAQNHIFKVKRDRKPLPFQDVNQDTTDFITLDELKILERRGKNTMDYDSDSDDHTSPSCIGDADTHDKCTEANDETNDDTLTTDGKETYDGEEDELFEEGDMDVDDTEDINDGNDTEDIHDEKHEEVNDEKSDAKNEEVQSKVSRQKKAKRKQKKFRFTMNYEVIEDGW